MFIASLTNTNTTSSTAQESDHTGHIGEQRVIASMSIANKSKQGELTEGYHSDYKVQCSVGAVHREAVHDCAHIGGGWRGERCRGLGAARVHL